MARVSTHDRPFARTFVCDAGGRAHVTHFAAALVVLSVLLAPARAQEGSRGATPPSRLTLGFAVDTTLVPATTWGVDAALAARPGVVRFWRDYLAVRSDAARRSAFWSDGDRRTTPDPDLAIAAADYIGSANATLVEALPLVAGDSTSWVLRTVYAGQGTATRPALLAMERVHVVREGGRWALSQARRGEVAGWRQERVGRLQYVVHPSLGFDAVRAAETARWVEEVARRFDVVDTAAITYFMTPDLETAWKVMGFDWALDTDRVGGRANARARVVFAADPRFGEAYRHEIVHVLLARWVEGAPAFSAEGIAYWLGGARGRPFPAMMRDLADFLAQHPRVDLRAILDGERAGAASSTQFPAAAALFELAHRRGGDEAVKRLVAATHRERPTVANVAAALAMTPMQLDAAWRGLVASYRAPTRPSSGSVE